MSYYLFGNPPSHSRLWTQQWEERIDWFDSAMPFLTSPQECSRLKDYPLTNYELGNHCCPKWYILNAVVIVVIIVVIRDLSKLGWRRQREEPGKPLYFWRLCNSAYSDLGSNFFRFCQSFYCFIVFDYRRASVVISQNDAHVLTTS